MHLNIPDPLTLGVAPAELLRPLPQDIQEQPRKGQQELKSGVTLTRQLMIVIVNDSASV